MDYRDIQQFRALFKVLKDNNFKSNINQIPSSIRINCLPLLRKLPQFRAEEFKNDNVLINTLNIYLKDPHKRKIFLDQAEFTRQQQDEFTQTLEEQPVATEGAGEQTTQADATQQTPMGEQPSTMSGGRMPFPGMAGGAAAPRRVIIQQPRGGMEGGTGTGTAATNKFQTPKVPYSFTNAAKNFGSAAGRFFQRNVGKYLTAGRLATVATTGIGMFAGASFGSPGILAGGITGALTPSFIKSGGANRFLRKVADGGINSFSNLSNSFSGGRLSPGFTKGFGTGKKIAVAFGLFGVMFGINLVASIGSTTTPTGQAAPVSSNSNLLDYTLPLKDPGIVPVDIRTAIQASYPKAKIEYWDKIIAAAKGYGLNPALALALWIEETGASQATLVANGGGGVPTVNGLSTGHLGCAPGENQTIEESIRCLNNFINRYGFTNSQFPEFMARYSGGPAGAPFSNNPNFTKNFRYWYSQLVPSGVGAIQATNPPLANQPTPTGPGCVAARKQVPALDEYDYSLGLTTCGPTSGAMVLQSLGKNVSIADVTKQWQQDGAWSQTVGFYPTIIPISINKNYPDLNAQYQTVKSADQVKNLIQASGNAIMVSDYYDNNAVEHGVDKVQTTGSKGNTSGGISITGGGIGHMIVVTQVCSDRVYINDPILGEKYSVPVAQFNQAISFNSRGEAIVVYSK